ncbi:hypothetical protein PR048_016858 [Dryococelus australis]|uniref:Uncharacterized protein n=1 Tax=Dryococelus australis TaxID=614101 RepID=A0ABQ9H7W2_9NEOP|nr:hypothetical protein PR048_016858 [Dryococelus australis]
MGSVRCVSLALLHHAVEVSSMTYCIRRPRLSWSDLPQLRNDLDFKKVFDVCSAHSNALFRMLDAFSMHGYWPPDAPMAISMSQYSLHVNSMASLALQSSALSPYHMFYDSLIAASSHHLALMGFVDAIMRAQFEDLFSPLSPSNGSIHQLLALTLRPPARGGKIATIRILFLAVRLATLRLLVLSAAIPTKFVCSLGVFTTQQIQLLGFSSTDAVVDKSNVSSSSAAYALKPRGVKTAPPTSSPSAERLACSPPTKAIRVQSPAGSLRIFACGNHAGRCRWPAGILGDLPFPPLPHSGAVPHSPHSPSSALKTSLSRAAQISSSSLASLRDDLSLASLRDDLSLASLRDELSLASLRDDLSLASLRDDLSESLQQTWLKVSPGKTACTPEVSAFYIKLLLVRNVLSHGIAEPTCTASIIRSLFQWLRPLAAQVTREIPKCETAAPGRPERRILHAQPTTEQTIPARSNF